MALLARGPGTTADLELLREVDVLIAEALSELRSTSLPLPPRALDLSLPKAKPFTAQAFPTVPLLNIPELLSPPILAPAQLLPRPLPARRMSTDPPTSGQTRMIERPLSAEPRYSGPTRPPVKESTSQPKESVTANWKLNGVREEEADARNTRLEVPRAVRNAPTQNGAAPKLQPPSSPRDAPLAIVGSSAFGRVLTLRQMTLQEPETQQRVRLSHEVPASGSVKQQRERAVDRASELEAGVQLALSLPHVDGPRTDRDLRLERSGAGQAYLHTDENLSLVFDGEELENSEDEDEAEEDEAALWLGPSRDRLADRPSAPLGGQEALGLRGLPPIGRDRSLGGGLQLLADASVVSTVGSSEALSIEGGARQRSGELKRPEAEATQNKTESSSQLYSLKLLKQVLSLDSSAGEARSAAAQANERPTGSALFIVNRALLERAGRQDAVLDALDLASAFENDLRFDVRIHLDKSATDISGLLRAKQNIPGVSSGTNGQMAVLKDKKRNESGGSKPQTDEQSPLSAVVLVTTGRSGDPLGACGRPAPIVTLLDELKNSMPAGNANATLVLVVCFEVTDNVKGTGGS